MTAICPNAQVEFDLLHRVRYYIMDIHDPTLEIDRLGIVLGKDPDVRDEERLFHELLVEERAAYRIDRLLGQSNERWA